MHRHGGGKECLARERERGRRCACIKFHAGVWVEECGDALGDGFWLNLLNSGVGFLLLLGDGGEGEVGPF